MIKTVKPVLRVLFLGILWTPLPVIAADVFGPPSVDEPAAPEQNSPDTNRPPAVAVAGRVSRALFTTDIKNREPVDTVSALGNDKTRVIYFTEILDMAGQTVVHRWEYKDKILLEKRFKVGASHWRIYTSKTLDPAWLGEWKASVVDANGATLCVNTFTYRNAPGGGSAPTPASSDRER